MRKYICISLTCLIFSKITTAQVGQIYKPFKVDIGIGTIIQSAKLNGLLFYMEPSYTFAGKFKTGIRFEQAVLSMKNIGSSALTFDYYILNKNSFRVFAGGGYSYYNTASSGGCDPGPTTTQIIRSTKNSGGLVRIGFDLNHFHLGLEYNFVPSTYVNAIGNDAQNSPMVIYKNNYFALKIGVIIRGSRKK
ncbi:MAG TPA: hypothetical protein VGZ90_00285 [Puia sp.]|jgi:hypothetical protein|nr:hypothetical protein [Puia sp.]